MNTRIRGIRVPDDLWQAAQDKARRDGSTVSAFVNGALRDWTDDQPAVSQSPREIAQWQPPRPAQLVPAQHYSPPQEIIQPAIPHLHDAEHYNTETGMFACGCDQYDVWHG